MARGQNGEWTAEPAWLVDGADYRLRVNGGQPVPDPRSRWQPHGVHGSSRWVDHERFQWRDEGWRAPPLSEGLIYELHVGTFSEEGTFSAIIPKLEYLRDLGVTFVELMPIAQFAGSRGWGYDGVNLYAPHHAYGKPSDLKRLIEACHRSGLGVILDVVYNHLGPEGNYLSLFGPYFTDRYKTPWGAAVNLDGPGSDDVRRFMIDNALMWLRDYHFDGLRIDAVHAFLDQSARHFLEQLSDEVGELSGTLDRPLVLIAESDLNDPRVVRQKAEGGWGLDAQWNEDFHHALHAVITGERFAYYADFERLSHLATVLEHGFSLDGRFSSFRGRVHGRPATGISGHRFVACLQNHDQIGNRAVGDRISHLIGWERACLGAALLLLGPFTPMLFQGEEWAASTPFQYFTDFEDRELAEAVRKGRREEFAGFGWEASQVPDPQAASTCEASRLVWSEKEGGLHKAVLETYRSLIVLRRQFAEFRSGRVDAGSVVFHEEMGWIYFRRGRFLCVFNFAERRQQISIPATGELSFRFVFPQEGSLEENGVELPANGVAVLEAAPVAHRTGVPR